MTICCSVVCVHHILNLLLPFIKKKKRRAKTPVQMKVTQKCYMETIHAFHLEHKIYTNKSHAAAEQNHANTDQEHQECFIEFQFLSAQTGLVVLLVADVSHQYVVPASWPSPHWMVFLLLVVFFLVFFTGFCGTLEPVVLKNPLTLSAFWNAQTCPSATQNPCHCKSHKEHILHILMFNLINLMPQAHNTVHITANSILTFVFIQKNKK